MRHGFIDLPEARIHYLEAGQGTPLVLVHGLAASWRWWGPVLAPLTRRHRVYAFDLPGFGQSRANRRLSLNWARQMLCRLMEALDLERASLVGHSMGGRICMDVAANCPERVDRLVLVATIGLPFGRSYARVGLDLLREGRATDPAYQRLVREDVLQVDWLELALTTFELLADDFRDHLASIAAPTLLVWGQRDVLTPPESGQLLAAAIPHARLALLSEAGHNPMWDQPERFSRLVVDFLATPSRPAVQPARPLVRGA